MSIGSFLRELTVEPLTPVLSHPISCRGAKEIVSDSVKAPDSIEPVKGWRAWRLYSTRHFDRISLPFQKRQPVWGLQSVYGCLYDQHLWPSGRSLTAECINGVKHEVPSGQCNCGVSAFHRAVDLVSLAPTLLGSQLSVIGQVRGWGRVIEHERGWRASQVYPISLGVICTRCRVEKSELRCAVYVVYWGPNKQFTLALCARHGDHLKRKGQVRNKALDFVSADVVERSLLKRYVVKPVGLWGLDHGYRVQTDSKLYPDTLWPLLEDGTHAPVQPLTGDVSDCATCGSECGECVCLSNSLEHRR
jgi:hypothetical protein